MHTLKIIENKAIDRAKWDSLLLANPNSFPYSLSWYLDIVSPNWKAMIIDDYAYALALPHRKKWGLSYVFPPEFTQQMGVFGRKSASSELVSETIEALAKEFRFIELNLNDQNELKQDSSTFRKKWRKNYELDLSKDYESIYAGFHKNTQRNIKKASKAGLIVKPTDKSKRMIEAFKDNKAQKIKGKKISYQLLDQIIKEGLKRNAIELYDVLNEDEYLGSALFLNSNGRKVFLFSSINDAGRKNSAMFFLINEIIKKNEKQHVILDFEGSDNMKLATFYKRFGAKEKLYLHLKINRLPFFIKWLKN
jgi:hypothetical protein